MDEATSGPVAIDQPDVQAPVAIDSPQNIYPHLDPTLKLNAEYGEAMANRAAKAAMGLTKKTGIPEQEFKDSIDQGQESDLRQKSASIIDSGRFGSSNIHNALTTTDPEKIRQMFQMTDPETVFERHYAQEFMDHLDWPKQDNPNANDVPLYGDMTGFAEHYDYVKEAGGSPYLAFKEYINTKRENGAAKLGAGAVLNNVIKDLGSAGMYSEFALRKMGILDPGVLMGENLKEQGSRLFHLAATDFNAAREQLDKTYDSLQKFDPVLADRWISAISGQSADERFFNDYFTVFNVLGTAAGLVKPFKTLAKTPFNRSSMFDNLFRGMTRTPDPSIPPKVAAPAMAGNVPESAVQKLSIDRINEFSGKNDPVRESKERIAGIYDLDGTAAASDPGRLGRELSNRMEDMYQAHSDAFLNRIYNVSRVNKIPGAVEVQENYRQIQKELADRHRGIDNSVLDISKPIYVEGSNNYAVNIAIGTHDADLFHDYEEMQEVARRNGLIEKGSIIESPDYLSKRRQLEGSIKGLETAIANAATGEGGARAANSIDLIRQRIKDLEDLQPRHKEGVTFERHRAEPTADELRMMDEGGIESRFQGHGFYINKVVYLPFDEPFVQNVLMTKPINTASEFRAAQRGQEVSTRYPYMDWKMSGERWWTGWAHAILGRGWSPAGRLSITENQMRQIATGGPSVLTGILKDGSPMKLVPRSDRRIFNRMLNYLQKTTDPATGLPGIWFETPQQMDTYWQTVARRSPNQNTVLAYFKYKNLLLDDLNMRDMLVGQRKRDRGIEQHNFKYQVTGVKGETGFFEGARLWELPSDGKYLAFLPPQGKNRLIPTGRIPPKARALWEADIKSGRAKLVQVADPSSKPFKDILPDRRVEYALTYGDNHQEKPLPVGGHVNRLGGGHLMPEYPWFIKQAKVFDKVYEGDSTVLNFLTRAQAEEALPHMENTRQAFLKYSKTARLGMSEEDLRDLERFEGEGGAVRPDPIDEAVEANRRTGIPFWKHYNWYFGKNKLLDINEPFHVVEINKRIGDYPNHLAGLESRHPGLFNATKGEGSLLSQVLPEFTKERDAEGLWTLTNRGTQQNPLFAYEPAPYVDPMVALDRGYMNIAKSLFNEDMKDYSITHWLEQAHPYLDTGSPNTLRDVRSNPTQHFYEPKYLRGTPKQIEWQLESNRKQAMDFWSHPSALDNVIRSWGQQMADTIYRSGASKIPGGMKLMSDLPKVRNPIGFFRNIAFHPIMGIFAWPTFLMQASTFANVFFISPRSAAAAAFGALMHGYLRINPSMINAADSMASGLGLAMPGMRRFRPGQLIEAIRHGEATGFLNVGNEHAFASNTQSGVFRGGVKKVADLGLLPFRMGANFVRRSAWFAAYLEHVENNPNVAVGLREQRMILDRARLLDHNMTSSMNTKLHTGAMSIPMQFQAFTLRIAEMMFGSELTPAEKMRMFVGSLAFFGAGAGGVGYYGFPLAHIMARHVEDWIGYVPGESVGWDTLMQGMLSVAAKFLSGSGDYSKGHLYDFSRFGDKGLDPIEDFISSDKSPMQILTNVVGGQWVNMWKNTFELRHAFNSIFTGQDVPITPSEVLDAFNTVREVANIRQTWAALKTGEWLTTNGNKIDDITKFDAVLKHLTGLSEVQGATVWQKQQEIQEIETDIAKAQSEISKLIGRAMNEILDNDTDNANKHFRLARNIAEIYITDRHKRDEAYDKAYKSLGTSMKDRVDNQLYRDLLDNIDQLQRIYREGMARKGK